MVSSQERTMATGTSSAIKGSAAADRSRPGGHPVAALNTHRSRDGVPSGPGAVSRAASAAVLAAILLAGCAAPGQKTAAQAPPPTVVVMDAAAADIPSPVMNLRRLVMERPFRNPAIYW